MDGGVAGDGEVTKATFNRMCDSRGDSFHVRPKYALISHEGMLKKPFSRESLSA